MTCHPIETAASHRPLHDLANIIRRHRPELEAVQPLSPVQGRALSAMALCRTAALGGHVDFCPACGQVESPSYNSCRNRNCPKCQGLAQERWIAARARAILPIPHFHGVLTLPAELRPLARRFPAEIYKALMQSSSAAVLELGRSRLGVVLGLTLILHTWNRELLYHLHTHLLITAGGLTLDGKRFKRVEEKFLLHEHPLSELFKGKMMAALRALHGQDVFGMTDGEFGTLMASVEDLHWHVYLKPAFRCAESVIHYLGRYTHRVGIANSRLVTVTENEVTFRSRDERIVRLKPVDFLQRFVQHILPAGFKKIRHAGLYASPKTLAQAKVHLGSPKAPEKAQPTWEEALLELTGRDVTHCSKCGFELFMRTLPPDRATSGRQSDHPPRSPP
jgi:hypothetical protein